MAHDTYVQDGKLLYSADLTALNNSGVAGNVTVLLDATARSVTVDVQASGLEPGQTHIQHFHGFEDDSESRSPTLAQDADSDGFVELGEGLPTYGPIQLELTANPGDSAQGDGTGGRDPTAAASFPVAAADGTLSYREVFSFAADDPAVQAIFDGITPLEAKEYVVHGMTTSAGQGAGTSGEVDGSAGYKLVLPVASGELMAVAPAADVLDAVSDLGLNPNEVVDWNAIAAQVTANFEATGNWFI